MSWRLPVCSGSITANLEIEPITIHPTKWGYRNNKNKNNYLLFLLQNEKHEHNFRDPRRQQGYHSGKSN